jgi:hypothetical protein
VAPLASFDPGLYAAGGVLPNGMRVAGYANYFVDEGGVHGDANTITGFSAWDPAHTAPGDLMYDYDARGQFVGTHKITPENGTVKDLATGIALVGGAALGANALFGGFDAGAVGIDAGAADGGLEGAVDAGAATGGGVTLPSASTLLNTGKTIAGLATTLSGSKPAPRSPVVYGGVVHTPGVIDVPGQVPAAAPAATPAAPATRAGINPLVIALGVVAAAFAFGA